MSPGLHGWHPKHTWGAPTCKAFAEDYVRGEVNLTDCIFLAEKGEKS